MSFGAPLLLLTLLAVPAAALVGGLAARRRSRYAVRFTNLDVLAGVARAPSWRRLVPPALFLLALTATGVALARPRVRSFAPVERATVVLVVDVSRSMEAQDVRPSRLAAAQAAALAFVRHAPKRLRIGIVVFAGEPEIALVPTRDHDLVARSIAVMGTSTGFGGTAIGDALVSAVGVGLRAIGARSGSGLVSILFLSDGRQNRGVVPPLDGAARARAARIPVYTVALGTASGGLPGGFGGGRSFGGGGGFLAPDPATLHAIARATGGEFTRARSAETLRAAYSRLGSRLGRRRARREVTYELVAAGAALLAAAGALGALWSPRLP